MAACSAEVPIIVRFDRYWQGRPRDGFNVEKFRMEIDDNEIFRFLITSLMFTFLYFLDTEVTQAI